MKKIAIILFLLFTLIAKLFAQDQERIITLDEAITIARVQSVDAAVALNELKTAYWEYRTFRANLLPEVNFDAVAPSYNKKYNSYQLEDGSYTFVRNNYLDMSGEISLNQNIWFTGGVISLNTSLDYLRQLDNGKDNRFMTIPVALTLNQPILGVNSIKWDRRIEPVRYAEAKAAFLSNERKNKEVVIMFCLIGVYSAICCTTAYLSFRELFGNRGYSFMTYAVHYIGNREPFGI